MSHQVLARKYRPQNFQQMAGQEHVLQALVNALNQNRLHHAYLFTGSRGVGKTTLARILAKCLNCESGISATPCGSCLSCQEISNGSYVDLIEVDAASRTKVEDTRELLENVQYAPARGRYKVYLIDEVHMLSGHSFNALLKTLEEPPSHIKFLLATTDPQRLPATVLSRCLQFNLKNLTPEKITAHLKEILELEHIDFESSALNLLARSANGSLRDALSLLDQAIAYSNNQITEINIRTMLGSIDQAYVFDLLEGLADNDAKSIFNTIVTLNEHATDFYSALEELLTSLHQIALTQIIPDAISETLPSNERIQHLAQRLTAENVQLYYQIGLIGRRDLPLAPNPRSGFEMILLRMLAFSPVEINKPTLTNHTFSPPQLLTQETAKKSSHQNPEIPVSKKSMEATTISTAKMQWTEIIPNLQLSGATSLLANNCILTKFTDTQVCLLLEQAHAALKNAKQEARLEEALANYFKKPIKLQITLGSSPDCLSPAKLETQQQLSKLQMAKESMEKDKNVQAILEVFDAKMPPDSIVISDDQ